MRFFAMFTALILLLGTFVACTQESIDLSIDEIASEIESAVPLEDGYHKVSEQYFSYYFKDDNGNTLNVSDWVIYKSSSQSSENEFGILSASSNNVSTVKSACENYIEKQRETYLEAKAAYTPEEYEKYANAKIKVYGNTVIYFIMTKEDSSSAIEKIDALNK